MRRDSEQYLEPLGFRDLQRRASASPTGRTLPAPLCREAPLPPTRPGPAAQDDITGKLRRLIGMPGAITMPPT